MSWDDRQGCGDDSEKVRRVIQKCFRGAWDAGKRYIVCIQGPTTTGKTTFSRRLYEMLRENEVNVYMLGLDSYYFRPLNPALDEEGYDYDNPAALDWQSVFGTLRALVEREPVIEHRAYSASCYGEFSTVQRANPMHSVVVIDGVQAFNTVSDRVFNIEEFDPHDSGKAIENEFVPGGTRTGDFKVLKILMTGCASKILSAKLRRDKARGRQGDAIVKRFYSKTLPGMLRWIYSPVYTRFIKVVHGNFNAKKAKILMDELALYFLGRRADTKVPGEEDFSEEFSVKCSGECRYGGEPYVVLDDGKSL